MLIESNAYRDNDPKAVAYSTEDLDRFNATIQAHRERKTTTLTVFSSIYAPTASFAA